MLQSRCVPTNHDEKDKPRLRERKDVQIGYNGQNEGQVDNETCKEPDNHEVNHAEYKCTTESRKKNSNCVAICIERHEYSRIPENELNQTDPFNVILFPFSVMLKPLLNPPFLNHWSMVIPEMAI